MVSRCRAASSRATLGDMGGSFLRVRGSLTTVDSEPRFVANLKAVLRGILRFCGGRIRDEIGTSGEPADVLSRNDPAGVAPAPRQPQGPAGARRGQISAGALQVAEL